MHTEPKLAGIIPPMITPLSSHDELDRKGLERLIEHILAGGVNGIFLLGTTGEAAGLSMRLRKELVTLACPQIAGRVPVVVGITDTAFETSLEIARHAAGQGVAAVVVAPPYNMPAGQGDLRAYLDHVAAESPLPVLLYNLPPLTRTVFELDTVRWAMDHPRIIGLKDSSGDLTFFKRVCALLKRPDWSLFTGSEELLFDSVLCGGHGGVAGGANVFPKLFVELYKAARERALDRGHDLYLKVLALADRLYTLERHPVVGIKAYKCALAHLGICGDTMAEPFRPFTGEKKAKLGKAVDELRGMF